MGGFGAGLFRMLSRSQLDHSLDACEGLNLNFLGEANPYRAPGKFHPFAQYLE